MENVWGENMKISLGTSFMLTTAIEIVFIHFIYLTHCTTDLAVFRFLSIPKGTEDPNWI